MIRKSRRLFRLACLGNRYVTLFYKNRKVAEAKDEAERVNAAPR